MADSPHPLATTIEQNRTRPNNPNTPDIQPDRKKLKKPEHPEHPIPRKTQGIMPREPQKKIHPENLNIANSLQPRRTNLRTARRELEPIQWRRRPI